MFDFYQNAAKVSDYVNITNSYKKVEGIVKGLCESSAKISEDTKEANAYKKVEGVVKDVYQSTAQMADKSNVTDAYKKAEGFVKGSKAYYWHQGKNYIMKFGQNTKLNIMSKAGKDSILRLDKAHVGHHEFNHINLNPKYSKITKTVIKSTGKVKVTPHDPHIKLPPGTLTAGAGTAKLCQKINVINDVLIPIAITIDVIRISKAAIKDYYYGSTRNTVETSTEVFTLWTSGYAGAMCGSAVGTGILPGFGTIIGGIIGGVAGGITGSYYASRYINKIGDALGYDIVKSNCKCCGHDFTARKYQGETCQNQHKYSHKKYHDTFYYPNIPFYFMAYPD